jgi:hypothetical protein
MSHRSLCKPRFSALCALLLVGIVGHAHADIKGSYELSKGNSLTLAFRDPQHMQAASGADKAILVKGDDTWALKRQGDGWLAVDVKSAGGLLAALKKSHEKDVPSGPLQLRALNRKETVAGYQGDVFELSDGQHQTEIVLTDNPDVLALTNAWRSMAGRVAENLEQRDVERLQQALTVIPQTGKGGLLRQGDNLKLTAVNKQINASDLELPAGTQTLKLPASIPGLQ